MRYFICNLTEHYDLEQKIKKKEVDPVFQVVIRDSVHIKKFIWFLLSQDIKFNRVAAGAGMWI